MMHGADVATQRTRLLTCNVIVHLARLGHQLPCPTATLVLSTLLGKFTRTRETTNSAQA